MARSLTISEHDGEYGVEIQVGTARFYAVIDTGFTHPRCETGLCVETALYGQLRPLLSSEQAVQAFSVGNRPHLLRSGRVTASIVGLDDSAVATRILDGGSNLVGVCFFAKLADYRLSWVAAQGAMRLLRR